MLGNTKYDNRKVINQAMLPQTRNKSVDKQQQEEEEEEEEVNDGR